MYYTYILYSPIHDKIYIGFTQDLQARFESHNVLSTKGYTLKYRPWEIIFFEKFDNKVEAMNREKQLKSHAGRDFVWKIVREKYP